MISHKDLVMNKSSFVLSLSAFVLLTACGEQGTTENITQINQMGMDVVASVKDLPKCTKDNEGEQAFVKGESSPRICVDKKWFATKQDSTKDSAADFSCITKQLKDNSGVKIICNGDSIGGGSYVAIIHPYVAYDLMQDAGEQWMGIQKYANPENILKGEIGTLAGVRFVESTEAKIYAPGEIADGLCRLTAAGDVSASASVTVNETLTAHSFSTPVPVYVNGVANTVTAISVDGSTGAATLTLGSAVTVSEGALICGKGAGKDGSAVFCTLFLGENAYGVTDIEGGGLEHIVKQRGYGNDPLNQRSSVGWKATKVAKRLL